MTIVANRAHHGLTVWYDATTLAPGAPTSEALCFDTRGERDARVDDLRRLPHVVDVTTWDADPGYSLTTYYEPH